MLAYSALALVLSHEPPYDGFYISGALGVFPIKLMTSHRSNESIRKHQHTEPRKALYIKGPSRGTPEVEPLETVLLAQDRNVGEYAALARQGGTQSGYCEGRAYAISYARTLISFGRPLMHEFIEDLGRVTDTVEKAFEGDLMLEYVFVRPYSI